MASIGSTRSSVYSVREYTPRSQFRFAVEGFDMFGRSPMRRPITTPAHMKQISGSSSRRTKENRFLEPEDIIAMAQSSSSPDYLQETIGSSLMLLKKGYKKVKPSKFLELHKIAKQQNVPLVSPRGALPTPRLVKQISHRVQSSSNTTEKATQYNYRSDENQPRLASRRPSTVGEVVVKYIASSHQTTTSHMPWQDKRNINSKYKNINDFSERCVRCAIFPDIQIDGRSLSKNLTNCNVVMSKEHCEILGPDSCPDCVKIRSQKRHEKHCNNNTSSVPTDVYKLALIYEHSPHLSMREVKRKVLDGEILDSVQRLPKVEYNGNEISNSNIPIQSELPEVQVTYTKPSKDGSETAQQYTKLSRPSFETIIEHSESPGESEDANATLKAPPTELDSKITFEKHESEKMRKIQLVPAVETKILASSFNKNNVTLGSSRQPLANEDILSTAISAIGSKNHKNDDSVKMNDVPKHSILKVRPGFTDGVVPSPNFFFDISDLAGRLRNSEIHERSSRLKQRADTVDFLNTLSKAKNKTVKSEDKDHLKVETISNSSSDSFKPVTQFNMGYEPPILFGNKGRYLGVKAPSSGRIASAAKFVN